MFHNNLIEVFECSQVKETEPEENEAAKKVQEFFKTVAGDDMEIDWSELKEVLDLALKRGKRHYTHCHIQL